MFDINLQIYFNRTYGNNRKANKKIISFSIIILSLNFQVIKID